MSPFRFRLEKVLEWRRLQLERAEAEFRQRASALAQIDRTRAELQDKENRTIGQVREWNPVSGRDLESLGLYRADVRSQQERLANRRCACERDLAESQRNLLEVQRRCRLLERLKERRYAEWHAGLERELQELASESFLARWNRDSRA